ncbi:family 20 glycosylhydrolase [Aureibaculum sp. A20]|uniref:beta-N-acetylhexosaminidase n=1 Tax=Aureibaculum flavum TaxID=2795986 RepID=A0ABS0WVP4_9FLAO|nr:family 20 glycosylhydrolase [Aureibaculum flavum]MBJ2176052.1 family 20 glycosylhydrolase [Aureibaculum flavum]
MKVNKHLLVFAILISFLFIKGFAQENISVVPYPKGIKLNNGHLNISNGFKIGYVKKELAPIAELMSADFYTLFEITSKVKKGKGIILLDYDTRLKEEEYSLVINRKNVFIKGGSHKAVIMGVTSLLQLGKQQGQGVHFPLVSIKDYPSSSYRGFMLDVARQWHNIATVKQVIDLCRWYKIKYMQFHLTDDQSFTFPSTAYPKLASPDRHYTLDELKDLVAYAEARGVTIIPEFDAPGHTQAMRKAMPELFGESKLGVINLADERVYKAMETIMEEMMAVFHTSPYFHIGADEAWLGEFEKRDETKAYIKKKGFDNAHDIYLDFMVQMHAIVKKNSKKTLIWESFAGDGSRKVKIPKDIIVFAWETAYQRPESLLKNGYTIINASWKPTYVTPGFRWNPDYIYKWNLHRWENHWNATPSYHNPIQLEESEPILGGQMCSWEMSEEQQIPSIHQRVPAISEVFWNGNNKSSYEDYYKRYEKTDVGYNRLIFPVTIVKQGFTEPNYEGIYYNKENKFGDVASLTFTPSLPNTKITYTLDDKMPTEDSEQLPSILKIDKDFKAKLGVFDKKGNRVGYKLVNYQLSPILPIVKGNTLALRDTVISRPNVEFIGNATLTLKLLKNDAEIRYTLDGSKPTLSSKLYTKMITVDKPQVVKAICFFKGEPIGLMYQARFIKKDFEKNVTTGKKVTSPENRNSPIYGMSKAVDGFVDKDAFWDSQGDPSGIMVDLEKPTPIKKIELFTYWDGQRYYQYDIELSLDGKNWTKVVDQSANKEKATEQGYISQFTEQKARYVRVNMLYNSANPSMHIIELRAY